MGDSEDFSDKAEARYIEHFGPLNQRLEIANHTFVLIDAPGLVEEDYRRSNEGLSYARWTISKPGGPIEFIQSSAAAGGARSPLECAIAIRNLPVLWFLEKLRRPTVLLTHIPLARPNGASGGPHREKGTIRQGGGFGYENMLSPQATKFILGGLRPEVVFRFVSPYLMSRPTTCSHCVFVPCQRRRPRLLRIHA